MKKFSLVLLALLVLGSAATAPAQPAPTPERVWLVLGTAESGNTTAASGSSIFVISTTANVAFGTPPTYQCETDPVSGTSSVLRVMNVKEFDCAFQLTGATVSQVQQAAGGDYSGTTVTVWYQKSLTNTAAAWNAATKTKILDGVLLSGASAVQTAFTPSWSEYLRFGFTSGITVMDGVKGQVSYR